MSSNTPSGGLASAHQQPDSGSAAEPIPMGAPGAAPQWDIPDVQGLAPVYRDADLPPGAVLKLRMLIQDRDERFAVTRALTDQSTDIRASLQRQESVYRSATTPSYARGDNVRARLGRDSPEALRMQAAITREREERDRIAERLADKKPAQDAAGTLILNIDDWLGRNAGAVFEPFATDAETKVRKGETPLSAVDRVRRFIGELKADLRQVLATPMHSDDAKRAARAYVGQLAEAAAPDVIGLVERTSATVEWPMTLPTHAVPHISAAGHAFQLSGTVHDGLALAALLHPERLTAVLERAIDAAADDAHAMSDKDRSAKVARIEAQILAEEREEEALIQLASAAGMTVQRRPDADPRAVLEVTMMENAR